MDEKQTNYGAIISSWLEEFVLLRQHVATYEYQLITDPIHHHYQVIRSGWHNDRFLHQIVFHFHIKPTGKVWLLVNNTDILVTDDLMQRGIPKTDIVIGFLPEAHRPYSGFAVA